MDVFFLVVIMCGDVATDVIEQLIGVYVTECASLTHTFRRSVSFRQKEDVSEHLLTKLPRVANTLMCLSSTLGRCRCLQSISTGQVFARYR